MWPERAGGSVLVLRRGGRPHRARSGLSHRRLGRAQDQAPRSRDHTEPGLRHRRAGQPDGRPAPGLRESDDLGLDLTADLDRLAGWAGARFHLSFSMRSGTSLSDQGHRQRLHRGQGLLRHTYRLVNVDFEQSLFDDRVSLRGGRIAAGDEFLTSPLYGNFVQAAFNGNPMGILFNVPMTTYPTATWGMRARVRPISQLSLMAGVYNGDPTLGDNDKHGVDWTMRGPLFAIGEVGVRLNQEPGATGLPGNYKIGGYYQAGKVPDLFRDVDGGSIALSGLPPQMHNGNGGFYLLLDQMIYRDGEADSGRGLTPFVSLLFAPSSSVNTMPFFANGGLVYQGLFPSRPHDTAAFGVAYGAFSRQLGAHSAMPGAWAAGRGSRIRGRARAHLYRPGEQVAAAAAGPSIHHQSRGNREDPQRAHPRIPARAHPVRRAAPSLTRWRPLRPRRQAKPAVGPGRRRPPRGRSRPRCDPGALARSSDQWPASSACCIGVRLAPERAQRARPPRAPPPRSRSWTRRPCPGPSGCRTGRTGDGSR